MRADKNRHLYPRILMETGANHGWEPTIRWGGVGVGWGAKQEVFSIRCSFLAVEVMGKQEMGEMSLLRVEKNRFINILPCWYVNTVR